MAWRIGVDIGGTFIDFCVFDTAANRLHTLKVLTTPEDPGQEVMNGLALLEARHGLTPGAVSDFVHGTTVGINTVIQRKGAELALLATAGFEDVVELARLRMPEMHSLFCARPEQLIPRDRIFGIPGRILADGSEQVPLDPQAVRRGGGGGAREGRARASSSPSSTPTAIRRMSARRRRSCNAKRRTCSSSARPRSGRSYANMSGRTTAILNGYVHPRVAQLSRLAGNGAARARRHGAADGHQIQRRDHERRRSARPRA